jgi:MFS family permease
MLNICSGRRDLSIALAGRMVSTFGDVVALVALTLRLQADGGRPYEVALLLAAGSIPLRLLARPVGRLVDSHDSRQLLVGAGLLEVACTVPLVFAHSVAVIIVLAAVLGAAALVSGSTWSALVFLVRGTLRAGGAWYGVAEAAWIAGVVAGSLGARRLRTEGAQIWATIAGAGITCAALASFAAVPAVWMLVPLSVLGGTGNGYANVCASTLLVTRTADAERGRVSAAANAAVGGAQGVSLLVGGVVAAVLSPREIYAMAGMLGVAAAIAFAVFYAIRVVRGSPAPSRAW